jgi:hypothetical protein
MPSATAKKLAAVASEQYDLFHELSENDPQLAAQIKKYWEGTGFDFPGVNEPWSAVFVSWCVKQSGATRAQFPFNPQHSQFVFVAIKNARDETGVFRAFPITDYAPQIGDIIHNNRDGGTIDFAAAGRRRSYPSHTAIVVETGVDSNGAYARTIGGNESDSIRRKRVALNNRGLVVQRPLSPYICVIQNRM